MLSTSRTRVRALAAVGMAAVVVTAGAVTFEASAAESTGRPPLGDRPTATGTTPRRPRPPR